MTITISPITKNQWKSVGKAVFWIALAYGLTLLVARLKDYKFPISLTKLGIPAYVNIVLFALSKFFIQEEAQAIANLPSQVEPLAQSAEETLTPGA